MTSAVMTMAAESDQYHRFDILLLGSSTGGEPAKGGEDWAAAFRDGLSLHFL